MAPYHRLKPHERSEIIGQRKARLPLKQISENLNIPYSTVKYTLKKSETRDEAQHDLPRSGRRRHSTRDQDNRVYRHLRINNNLRWPEVVDIAGIKRIAIQNRMREIDPNFKRYRRPWSVYLSPANIRERKKYAKDYGPMTPEWWANV